MLSTMVGVGNATGAAMRRRQRRLRAWARHERLSIAMALATVEHNSYGPTANAARRGQTTGTSGREEEVCEQHYGLRAQKRPLLGMRPAPLLEVLPQVGVQRHAVDQIVDVPGLPTLDGPVPLLVEQLVDVLQLLDALLPVAEQVIDVPKMFIERIPPRTSVREPQLAEQLVEVPTIVSFSSLQRIMEQTVDNPASRGRGRHGGLQGFFPGQSTKAAAVDTPVPRGDLQGSLPGQGSPASSSHSPDAANEARGFSHFSPWEKKCRGRRPGECGHAPACQFMDAGGL